MQLMGPVAAPTFIPTSRLVWGGKLCHPELLTPKSFIYLPLTREKEAINGSAAEIWSFNLVTNWTQLKSKAKKRHSLALAASAAVWDPSLSVPVAAGSSHFAVIATKKGDQGCLQVLLLKLLSFRTIYQHFHTIFQPLSSAALCNVPPSHHLRKYNARGREIQLHQAGCASPSFLLGFKGEWVTGR